MPKCFPALIAASIQLTAVLIFLNVDAIAGVGNKIGRSHKWEEWGGSGVLYQWVLQKQWHLKTKQMDVEDNQSLCCDFRVSQQTFSQSIRV
jgi:hypothetical protein